MTTVAEEGIEEKIHGIEARLRKMEDPQTTLDEACELYDQGVRALREAREILEARRERVMDLIESRADQAGS